MRFWLCPILIFPLFGIPLAVSADDLKATAYLQRMHQLCDEVRNEKYADLRDVAIQVEWFDSPSDYFQTRFTFTSFLWRSKLGYVLKVNRRLMMQAPPETALRAILAHELEHLKYYQSRSRLRLLSLTALLLRGPTIRFERRADLQAIVQGYGEGLRLYRDWLYQHIPLSKLAEKKRNYFSPPEIVALQTKLQTQPSLLKEWRKRPPRSLAEIEQAAPPHSR